MRASHAFLLGLALVTTVTQADEKRELLARNETIAVFKGAPYRECMGLTSLCPKECGHSGEFATFEIRGYLVYEKRGQYGDPKQGQFMVQITGYHKEPVGNLKWNEIIKTLKPDDCVLLSWNHDYVTKDGCSSPERPITNLKKITAAEAAELLKKAEAAPAAPKAPKEPGKSRGAAPAARA
ncbi:MAG: hypothetical protein NTY53_04060, partial [Kiritimatiellaeota bacterium]|nr:hypothetical protein [Kiritimatiellota bacterium]